MNFIGSNWLITIIKCNITTEWWMQIFKFFFTKFLFSMILKNSIKYSHRCKKSLLTLPPFTCLFIYLVSLSLPNGIFQMIYESTHCGFECGKRVHAMQCSNNQIALVLFISLFSFSHTHVQPFLLDQFRDIWIPFSMSPMKTFGNQFQNWPWHFTFKWVEAIE